MHRLEKRIAALEWVNPTNVSNVMLIVFNTPGLADMEIHKLHSSTAGCEDQEWIREPGETEQEFKHRAKREVTLSKYGTALLFKTN